MVMIKSLFLAGLMFALAKGDASPAIKPLMATLQVQPNFDFSLTRKEFRVHYSGLGEGFTAQGGDETTIKIYNQGGDLFHSYTVDDKQKNNKKAYYFALDGARNGGYEVEVCSGQTCSGKTPALTEIADKELELTCSKGKKGMDDNGFETWTPSGEYKITFKGPSSSDWMTDLSEFERIEAELNKVLKKYGVKNKYQTDYSKHGFKANPTYEGKKFYAAVKYNIAQYKDLFDKYRGESDTREEYAHDKCKRKYLLSAHAHLVDTQTKEVKYRYKTTLHLSGAGKQYYILDPKAIEENRKVHVEMTHENVDIAKGKYQVHVIFCATEKDTIESTYCADPIISSSELEVGQDQ